jgi:amidohydrolase
MVRILFWLLFAFVSQTIAQGQSLDALVEQQIPELITTFQTLHANPELSHHEKNTAQFMATQLRTIGYEVTEQFGQYNNPQLTCYGIVALLKNGAGPTVLYRADMDALPIEEKTNLAYASKVRMKNDEGEIVPVMHACGHDMHCTVLLGVARTLYALRKKWSGTLMLIVQPAEEVNDSGGYAMMRAGLYDKFIKPDYALPMALTGKYPVRFCGSGLPIQRSSKPLKGKENRYLVRIRRSLLSLPSQPSAPV